MVTTRFIGRLGNSMFQLAACIGYAKKYGYQWAGPSNPRESCIYNVFPHIPQTHAQPNSYPKRDGYDASQYNYTEIPNVGDNVLLAGFWQSEKYFENAKDEVRKVFKLDIKPVDAVSIHVRRGDYVKYAGSFPPITLTYIKDALYKIGYENVIVLSDDIQWCKDNLPIHFSQFKYTFSEGGEFQDLSLMASCSHHIIANSSFSWWGAWLGHNPDKIIVCPSYTSWYGPENSVKNPIDLIPSGWHQITFR